MRAHRRGDDDFYRASLLLVFAMFFDMLDGRVARLTKTQSAFGLQIDSLADVVSFGVAPALLVYKWSLFQQGTVGLVVAFMFAGAGAVRLARFNVLSMGESGKPTKPGKYIVGLPVPGAAGILISLVVANHAVGGDLLGPKYVYADDGRSRCFLAFLMVSTIRFRSFKDLKLNARTVALVALRGRLERRRLAADASRRSCSSGCSASTCSSASSRRMIAAAGGSASRARRRSPGRAPSRDAPEPCRRRLRPRRCSTTSTICASAPARRSARGDLDDAANSLVSAAQQTHVAEHDYLSVLRPLAEVLARRNDVRAARSRSVVHGVLASPTGGSARWRCCPACRRSIARARSRRPDDMAGAAREMENAGLVAAAAIYREKADDWRGARALWSRLAQVVGGGADAYNGALVQFNLARCAKKCGDARQAREANVAAVRLLEEAADYFESVGQRERAFDCFQVLVQIGRESGMFEDVLEGFVNCIRILREDHLKYFALQYFEDALTAAKERGELSAAATLAREAADYARVLGMASASAHYIVCRPSSGATSPSSTSSAARPPEIAENALLAGDPRVRRGRSLRARRRPLQRARADGPRGASAASTTRARRSATTACATSRSTRLRFPRTSARTTTSPTSGTSTSSSGSSKAAPPRRAPTCCSTSDGPT